MELSIASMGASTRPSGTWLVVVQTLGAGKLALEQVFGQNTQVCVPTQRHLLLLCIYGEVFPPKTPRTGLMHTPGQKWGGWRYLTSWCCLVMVLCKCFIFSALLWYIHGNFNWWNYRAMVCRQATDVNPYFKERMCVCVNSVWEGDSIETVVQKM